MANPGLSEEKPLSPWTSSLFLSSPRSLCPFLPSAPPSRSHSSGSALRAPCRRGVILDKSGRDKGKETALGLPLESGICKIKELSSVPEGQSVGSSFMPSPSVSLLLLLLLLMTVLIIPIRSFQSLCQVMYLNCLL